MKVKNILLEDKEPIVKIGNLPAYTVVNPTPEEEKRAAEEQGVDRTVVVKGSEAEKEAKEEEGEKEEDKEVEKEEDGSEVKSNSSAALKIFVQNLLDDIKELVKSL